MIGLVYTVFPVLVVVGTLLVFRRERRLVEDRLRHLAGSVGGEVHEGRWPYHARLAFTLEGSEAQVSCLYNTAGNGRPARTHSWVVCDGYGDLCLDLERRPPREGLIDRLGRTPADTGHDEFDRAFWCSPSAGAGFLHQELREALLAIDPAALVHLRVGRAPLPQTRGRGHGPEQMRLEVTVQGVPPKMADLEAQFEVTRLAHASLVAPRAAMKVA